MVLFSKIIKVLLVAYKNNFSPENIRPWFIIVSTSLIAGYLYSFFEWLFFVSQPSYAAVSTNLVIKLSVLFFSGLIIGGIFTAVQIILFILSSLIPLKTINTLFKTFGRVILSFLFACLILLLIDNFSYTLFRYGIIKSSGFLRAVYLFVFGLLIFGGYKYFHPLINISTSEDYQKHYWRVIVSMLLLIASILFILPTFIHSTPAISSNNTHVSASSDFTNILLIGSDGLNADNLSVYGYTRDTTPNLAGFSKDALLAQNAFHNATTSYGSISSILTGKLPTTTRVLYAPDILIGNDALNHLPGILKANGYRTIEIAVPHYVDSYIANFQKGFDTVNNRSSENYPMMYVGWKLAGDYPAYFISITVERITSRLKHIFFIEKMGNPYDEVTTGGILTKTDRERIDQTVSIIEEDNHSPFFIHLHLMGTHGPEFTPRTNYFASNSIQDESNEDDFYDDAIRDFDIDFQEIVQALINSGKLENSIIVIYSDHGRGQIKTRVPWIIRFPNKEYSGVMTTNVQNLDIAPTILDYLNFDIPEWMEGSSVLENNLSPTRRIFLAEVEINNITKNSLWNEVDPEKFEPPFYQFGNLRMIACDHFYQVDLVTIQWSEGPIDGHTAPCDPATLLTLAEARTEMIQHLSTRGFDVSSLQN